MPAASDQLSRKLRKRRKRLLAAYDAEELHQLRIVLRRIRSALKQLPGHKAGRLRRELGQLAAATNAARDWDTLYCYARDTLTAAQFSQLQSWLAQHRQVARQQVNATLKSRQWREAYRHWRKTEQAATGHSRAPLVSRQEFARVLRRASAARRKAMTGDDDRRWHKLRIRIKELRYTLDRMAKPLSGLDKQVILARCKQLQQSLGDWHDTVIHRQLLDAFPDTGRQGADEEAAAVRALQRALQQRGRQCLETTREIASGPLLLGD